MAMILVVDDQAEHRSMLERLLTPHGYDVLHAADGARALEIAEEEHPDLILLDVMMPEMDGIEVLRRLRETPSSHAVPIVLMTPDLSDQRLKIQGLNLGADEYLAQPINDHELLARIRALLRTKQAQDELKAANTQLQALLHVMQTSSSSLALAEVARHLVDGIVDAVGVEAVGIWMIEDTHLVRVAEHGYPDRGVRTRQRLLHAPGTPLDQAIADKQVVYGSAHEIYGSSHAYGTELQSIMILPLEYHGTVCGVLQLGTYCSREFSPNEVSFLKILANAAATSLQNARLFEETDQQRQKLEALDNEKDEFISIITHELKNPLASIKGYAGLLTRRARKDPNLAPATKGLEVIEQQVNRMTMLLDQLRDVSHIGINRFSIEPQVIDMVALVERTVANVKTLSSEHTVTFDVKENPLLVRIDEFRMEQVLTNLVGNAVKYSPDGGLIEVVAGRAASTVGEAGSPELAPDWVVVTVQDHGIGIPARGRKRLFERFYRAENAKGRVSGMGLGLFIAREIVLRHGGTMWVESEEGKGSLFGVALPPAPNT